jgi:hypothetical protein
MGKGHWKRGERVHVGKGGKNNKIKQSDYMR